MSSEILQQVWYMAFPSEKLRGQEFFSQVVCGEPIVFFRDGSGRVRALRNICPHRGIPLSYGRLVENEVECPYHGWKFNSEGVCTEIPSLASGQDLDCKKIKVKSFLTYEQYGQVWIFMGDSQADFDQVPKIPSLPFFSVKQRPRVTRIATFPCHVDHAVIGLMDPAHGPYVHKSWFWRTKKSAYEKKKTFAPVPHGFQMVRHAPSKNSRAYRVLGGSPATEITFTLPCVRVEHVTVGAGNFVSYTALLPVSEKETLVYQLLYWDISWLSLLKPLIARFTDIFLGQDLLAVTRQQEGLKFDPSLMLIKDADTQAKWYYALKKEYLNQQETHKAFENPVRESVLSWRS